MVRLAVAPQVSATVKDATIAALLYISDLLRRAAEIMDDSWVVDKSRGGLAAKRLDETIE